MVADFNSIKVRLELFENTSAGMRCVNFNSIKVRLEHSRVQRYQALNGFQFHKGAIRTRPQQTGSSSLTNFNSIKVRLEREAGAQQDYDHLISIP